MRFAVPGHELPPDPFAGEWSTLRLWRVRDHDPDTGEVAILLTREGWGWLHTHDEIESNGTYGDLIVSDEEVTDHDASAAGDGG